MIYPFIRQAMFSTGCLLALAQPVFAQHSSAESITAKLETIQKKGALTGFAVAVVTADSVLYQHAFGFSDVAAKQLYTVNTLQPIASVSKTVVGVAIAKAIELGLFTLETPINDILPFPVINPNDPTGIIRVKHLVSHTSGITDRPDAVKRGYVLCEDASGENTMRAQLLKAGYGNEDKDITLPVYLTEYLQTTGKLYSKKNFLKTKPGATYEYSNVGTALAAWLITLKSGMAFPDFTKQYIFNPLKMAHTSWRTSCTAPADMAQLYNEAGNVYPRYRSASYPDGGLVTSCTELSVYLQEMIKGYAGKDGLLQKASYELLYQPMFPPGNAPKGLDEKEPNTGILWVHRMNGVIGHTGSDAGVGAFMFFKPEKQLGLILVTNSDIENMQHGGTRQLADFVAVWKEIGDYGKQVLP
ncbi:serine hydrolase domain-containing protein [Chitinophaga arvensicola]|uniref:CubicO group peptidase, beta-lactamase class C family n=1 Tax=Chitinophaga arvensicola TaxID=29529 RepID=A0A1I0S7Q9_9BACT|nr:serine hydrolase domain-containing protein [Chitinophaga arvensicola]SEW51678.1 CubicO group peptidase, beta-lactamase class C family [Chitinophaga arvensicola]